MNNDERINNFLSKVQDLVNQMRALGEVIRKQRVVEIIIICISDIKRSEMVVISIEVSKDLTTLKIVQLSVMLIIVEEKNSGSESLEHAFATKAKIRPSFKG